MKHALALTLFSSFVALALDGCAGSFDVSAATGFQTIERKEGRYWAYVPNDAAQREQRGELLPVLVYLHDADARGDDPEQAPQGALGKIIEQSHGQFPCVVLFPLLAQRHVWTDSMELARLDRIIDDALHRVGGDPDRIYLTGVGLGATGAWQAAAGSRRFAALVPVAGSADVALAPAIGKLPVWAFHGANDATRPPMPLVGALGGTAKLTLLPNAGHDIAARAYREPGLVEWLLAQKRAASAPPTNPENPAPAGT